MSLFAIRKVNDSEYYLGGIHNVLPADIKGDMKQVDFDAEFQAYINKGNGHWEYDVWEYDWLNQLGYETFKIHVPYGLTFYATGSKWSSDSYINTGMNTLKTHFNAIFKDFDIKVARNGSYERGCDHVKIILDEIGFNSFIFASIPIVKFLQLDLTKIDECDWSTVVNYNSALRPYRGMESRAYKQFSDIEKLDIISRLTS